MDNVTQLRPKGAFSPFVALLAIQVLFAGDLARMGIAMALVSRTIVTGHCEASYTAIAEDLGIAKRTVDRHMPAIVSTGILHRTDPMVPCRYRWDLARLAELAATREQSSSKPHLC